MREAESWGNPIQISPLTRKKLISGIPLGASEEHVKAANWSLFRLTSSGKRFGNPDFWFGVIWIILERSMIPYLNDVLPFVREQMIFRLKNRMSSASLSGLSTFCQKRLPLIGSCWFCLSSPFFITKETKNQNMLRYHLSHSEVLKKMIDLVGYKLPEGIERVLARTSAFASLLGFKRDHRNEFDVIIQCLYQNSISFEIPEYEGDDEGRKNKQKEFGFGKFFIPADGPASEESRENVFKVLPHACRKVPLKDLVYIAKYVYIQKSATDNEFPMIEDAPELLKPITNWERIDAKFEIIQNVKNCKNTMRLILLC